MIKTTKRTNSLKSLILVVSFTILCETATFAAHKCEDKCRTKRGNTIVEEARRIETCLVCLSRKPKDDELVVYRWGASKQIQDMMNLGQSDYYEKGYAFQNMRELATNRYYIKIIPEKNDVATKHCFNDNKCRNDLKGNIANGFYQNIQLDLKYLDSLKKISLKFDSRIWNAMAWELIYPGFIQNYRYTASQEIRILKRKSLRHPHDQEIQGKLIGLQVFEASLKKRNLRRSTMTWGRGTYWALDAMTSLAHFEDNYLGISCNLDRAGTKIVDLDYLHKEGKENIDLLFKSEILHGYGNPMIKFKKMKQFHEIYSPNGYNKFTNPKAFEQGASKYIIRFTSSSGTSLVAKKNSFDIRHYAKQINVNDIINSGCQNFNKLIKVAGPFTKKGFLDCLTDKPRARGTHEIVRFLKHGYINCYPKGSPSYKTFLIFAQVAIENVQNQDLKKALSVGELSVKADIDILLSAK